MCCDVDPRITESRVQECDGVTVDILVYRCPICHRTWERQVPRAQSSEQP